MVDIRTEQHRRRWGRLVAAPLGVVALVSLTACGTSTGTSAASSGAASDGATSTATATADPAGAGNSTMAAFRSCMAQNGVTLPERRSGSGGGGTGGAPPQGAGGGTPPSGAPAAPAEGGQAGDQGGGQGHRQGRTPGEAPPGVDATKWAAARQACASLAPTPPGGAAPSAS